MSAAIKLKPDSLTASISLDTVDFSQLAAPEYHILGQPRAQSALQFGLKMKRSGYNIYVMGEPGWGRLTMISNHLKAVAKTLPTPMAYGYVHNFSKPREPEVICLPSSQGQAFCNDIEALIDTLLVIFPAVFESPSYLQKRAAVERCFKQSYEAAIDLVEKRARNQSISLFRDGDSISFAPLKQNKTLNDAEFADLSQPEQDEFQRQVEELEDYLSEVLLDLPQWRRSLAHNIKQLDNETIQAAISPLFATLEDKYHEIKDACRHLSVIKANLNNTIAEHLTASQELGSVASPANRNVLIELYLPNILVDYQQDEGAPVVHEPNPTFQNLFGVMEYVNERGNVLTNYRYISPGSLHKANGGYLILDAEKVLTYPFVWEAIKRAIHSGQIAIEAPNAESGSNIVSLKPKNIPISVKVILLGSEDTYYLLEGLDNEFNEMFKVLVDFDADIPLTPKTIEEFAALIQDYSQKSLGQALTVAAVERLAEHSCRQAEDQQRFSAHLKDVQDIVSEAQLFSGQADTGVIDKPHIEQALAAREFRNGKISQEVLDEMLAGTILIDSEGEAAGKINGLTVLEIGGSSFGAPARITATVYPGSRGIVDIEREAELGQAIHTKGVMILAGYLGHCYAQQIPLAISASIAIEQSYGYIDGDSASLAELCCLISALTRIPIKQSFAVTGSINQYGEVQAIGGVNEKIEGFFRLCRARGLNGSHAVIIPAVNQRNLMLNQEVIVAVKSGLFSIFAVSTVDQTLELLTGKSVGTVDREGNYPEDSINFKAMSRLKEISEIALDDDKEEA